MKDTSLVYLDDVRSSVRKAAANAVSLLKVNTKRDFRSSLSHNLMFEILNKLLTIAISDPSTAVREIMLKSLNSNFDAYLQKPSNLQKLLLTLNDESLKVQQ